LIALPPPDFLNRLIHSHSFACIDNQATPNEITQSLLMNSQQWHRQKFTDHILAVGSPRRFRPSMLSTLHQNVLPLSNELHGPRQDWRSHQSQLSGL
jgi:hypothetical protein